MSFVIQHEFIDKLGIMQIMASSQKRTLCFKYMRFFALSFQERCEIFIRFPHHLPVFIKWRSTFKSLLHTLELHVDFVQWKKWLKLWHYDKEEKRINFYALWMWLDDETFHINSKDNFVFCFYAMPQWLHSKMLRIKFMPYYSCRRKKRMIVAVLQSFTLNYYICLRRVTSLNEFVEP